MKGNSLNDPVKAPEFTALAFTLLLSIAITEGTDPLSAVVPLRHTDDTNLEENIASQPCAVYSRITCIHHDQSRDLHVR